MTHRLQMKKYADRYHPLTLSEQVNYMEDSNLSDIDKIMILVKHNARIISQTVNRWYKTFDDIEDAYGLAWIAIYKAFETFDYTTYLFGTHVRLYISSALHSKHRKYISDAMIEYNEDAYECEYNNDGEVLIDILGDILTKDELQFIKSVYFEQMSISDAGIQYCNTSPKGASKIHRRILAKIGDKSHRLKELIGEI